MLLPPTVKILTPPPPLISRKVPLIYCFLPKKLRADLMKQNIFKYFYKQWLPPICMIFIHKFRYNGTIFGTQSIGTMPDTQRQRRFDEHRGLWMLYMDFKSHHKEWQAFNTVHPSKEDGKCDVLVKIVRLPGPFHDIVLVYGLNFQIKQSILE